MQQSKAEGSEQAGRHSHPVLATFVLLTCLVSIVVLAFVLMGFQRMETTASEQAARLVDLDEFVRQQALAPRESEALMQNIEALTQSIESIRRQIADAAKKQDEAVLAVKQAAGAAQGEVSADIQALRMGLDERLSPVDGLRGRIDALAEQVQLFASPITDLSGRTTVGDESGAGRFAPAGLGGTRWRRPEVGDLWVFEDNGVVTAGSLQGTWKQVDRRTIGVSLRNYYAITFDSDMLAHARTIDSDHTLRRID